jgi:histidinol-phosphate aminotransferase
MSRASTLARPEIAALKAYEHAEWDLELTRLHANELPWRTEADHSRLGLNRYPEPQPRILLKALADLYSVAPECVLVGRGSDDCIDLLVRTFCRAFEDAVILCPPTFGMYAIAAEIQGARIVSMPLRASDGFALDEPGILRVCTPDVKLVFLCSPNNPTGNLLSSEAILRIAEVLAGRAIVVVDEAYIEFAQGQSLAQQLPRHDNLAILRTLSKAHALAGVRCGTLLAHADIIALVRKVITPYAVSELTLESVMQLLVPEHVTIMNQRVALLRAERERLKFALEQLPKVLRVWPSEANFILAEFEDAAHALTRAREAKLLVRHIPALPHMLRITVGAPAQNERLLEAWT